MFSSPNSYLFLFGSIGTLNPKVLLELFSLYRDWQEEKAKNISQKQVCIKFPQFSKKGIFK